MKCRHRFSTSFCRIQLSAWAWFSILIYLSSFVNSLSYSSSSALDHQPRAALVTLAHEHDLPAMLSSISQLEANFNNRYNYHWIFFSREDLSEKFKQSTSNATNAICIYEVIPDENWSVPRWIDSRRLYAPQGSDLDWDHHAGKSVPDLRQIYRWNSGLFAQERRLKDYDWFWRVEPGAQFPHNIHFDVFKFMRDNGITYGFNKEILDETRVRELSPQIRSFIDKHPDLLHADADVSWLLDPAYSEDAPGMTGEQEISRGVTQNDGDPVDSRVAFKGSASLGSHPLADWQQDDGNNEVEADDGDTSSLADAFTSWLSGIYENSLYPTFEIGSLAFFRSPSHLAFFEHLDSAGEFYYRRVEDVPVHTLSASMFLPKQRVWNFRKRVAQHSQQYPSLPDPTPDPEFDLEFYLHDVEADSTSSVGDNGVDKTKSDDKTLASDAVDAMTATLKQWEWMARDFGRQEGIPGLMSGNTVIDERNFALACEAMPTEIYHND